MLGDAPEVEAKALFEHLLAGTGAPQAQKAQKALRTFQRRVLSWRRRSGPPKKVFFPQLALFPADRPPPATDIESVQVRLDELRLENPRQWDACWLADQLWRTLHLDDFFGARLPLSREDTDWEKVLRILVIYRLLAPGSEWRLHRHWFSTTALAICSAWIRAPRGMARSTAATITCCH